ncbi:protein DESIGUAL 3-like [Vigna umbellata]|uniref:protein DESIGUAL 3-like n=1 Tax=Vigna umbellata TaxID=87088 RepID=UPI001F5FE857|nr:protein DESIGUAL 3-like [Vigna umbellata]XP_047169030.1 protein DESIGUAL 3-like [Vigna umbellata]
MAQNYGFLVCILVLVLDVAAGILGIQAEIAENKVKELKMWALECRDPSFGAFKLGVAASVLLAFAHAFAHLLGGCICMRSKEECERATANRQLAVSFFLLSWMVLAIGFSLLILGTLANSRSRESCGMSNRRFLSIGGILCFVHGLFTVVYYVSVTATRREEKRQGNPIVSHP